MKVLRPSFFTILITINLAASLLISPNNSNASDLPKDKIAPGMDRAFIGDVMKDVNDIHNVQMSSITINKDTLAYDRKHNRNRKLALNMRRIADKYNLKVVDAGRDNKINTYINDQEHISQDKSLTQNYKDDKFVNKSRILIAVKNFFDEYSLGKKKPFWELNDDKSGINFKNDKDIVAKFTVTQTEGEIIYTLDNMQEPNINTHPHQIFKMKKITTQKINEIDKDPNLLIFIDSSLAALVNKSSMNTDLCKKLEDEFKNIKENNPEISCLQVTNILQKLIYKATINDKPLSKTFVIIDNETSIRMTTIPNNNNFIIEIDKASIDHNLSMIVQQVQAVAAQEKDDSIPNTIKEFIDSVKNASDNSKYYNCGAFFQTNNPAEPTLNFEDDGVAIYDKVNKDNCFLSELKIVVSTYNFGLFDILHLKLKNDRFESEYTVDFKTNINIKIKEMMDELYDILENIPQLEDTSLSVNKDTLKLNINDYILTIKKMIKKPNTECQKNKNSIEILYHEQCIPIITLTEIKNSENDNSEQKDSFDMRIMMTSPLHKNMQTKHEQVILKATNSFDQFDFIKPKITKFIESVENLN